jgi:hypothetical protein
MCWAQVILAAHVGLLGFFIMLVACSPQGTRGRVAAQSPLSKEAGSGATGHVALWSLPSGYGSVVHVAALVPSLLGRRAVEPLDMWQPRSPPQLGGRI